MIELCLKRIGTGAKQKNTQNPKEHLAQKGKACFHMPMENVLDKIKTEFGGPVKLAKAIGNISSQAISQWKKVPAERVLDVERETGISRHELRPDIFGEPDATVAGAAQ